MNLHTNYRDTFVKFQNPERTKPILPQSSSDVVYESNRPFLNKSQTSLDFIRYPDHKPARPIAADYYMSNLNNLLYPGAK